MAEARLVLLAVEGIEDHPVDEILRLVHLLLAAEELQSYLRFTFLHLPTNAVDRLLQDFEDVDRAVEVSNLAAHGD